jgi:hypothetical protein
MPPLPLASSEDIAMSINTSDASPNELSPAEQRSKPGQKGAMVIDEALVNKAILAIESTEPSPKEREHILLAQLIPAIMQALRRGDTETQVRDRLKARGITLHHKKLEKLFEKAALLLAESAEPLSGGA